MLITVAPFQMPYAACGVCTAPLLAALIVSALRIEDVLTVVTPFWVTVWVMTVPVGDGVDVTTILAAEPTLAGFTTMILLDGPANSCGKLNTGENRNVFS